MTWALCGTSRTTRWSRGCRRPSKAAKRLKANRNNSSSNENAEVVAPDAGRTPRCFFVASGLERMHSAREAVQIAGNKCKVCQQNLVLSTEGKFCKKCEVVVHVKCDSQPDCPVCGQPYSAYEPCKGDPAVEAFVPRALRPVMYGGAILLLIAGLAFVFVALYYVLFDAFAHAH